MIQMDLEKEIKEKRECIWVVEEGMFLGRVCSMMSIVPIGQQIIGNFQKTNKSSQELQFTVFNMFIKEMDIESSWRFHLIIVRMIKIKKKKSTSGSKSLGKGEPSGTVGGIASWHRN